MPDLTLEEAQRLLLIDRDNLDTECSRYAEILFKIGTACAVAVSERDEAKLAVDQAYANSAQQIRITAERNSQKLTEAKVEELVKTSEEYIDANTDYLEKKLKADLWYSMKDAFASRGKMLVEVCNLFLSGYFGEKVVRGDVSVEEAGYKAARNKISKEHEARTTKRTRRQ